jgi:hypothetical protein
VTPRPFKRVDNDNGFSSLFAKKKAPNDDCLSQKNVISAAIAIFQE